MKSNPPASWSSQLIEPFLSSDALRFKELLGTIPADDARLSHFQLLYRYLEMRDRNDGHLSYPQIEAEIYEAVRKPSEDPVLFSLLISACLFFYVYSFQRGNAGGWISYLHQLENEKRDPHHQVLIQSNLWTYYRSHRDYPRQRTALEKMFRLVREEGSSLWRMAMTHQIESALLNQDWSVAGKSLDALEPYRHMHPWQGLGPYEFMKMWLLFSQGKNEEALPLIEGYPPEKMGRCRIKFFIHHVRILINLDRLDEAERLLQEAAGGVEKTNSATLGNHRTLTSTDHETLLSFLELARRNFDKARGHAQQAIALFHANRVFAGGSMAPGYNVISGRFALLFIELASGRARAARLILQVLDPKMNKFSIEWARLHLLEGDREKAVQFFKEFMTRSPETLESKLRFAFELSPARVAAILTRLPPSEKKERPAPPSRLSAASTPSPAEDILVGESIKIQEVRARIKQFAPMDGTILISGETGSGKDVAARLIHQGSPRASEPFIPVNCGALSDTLIESELFGHMKGAFTGAHSDHAGLFLAAGKGTIFLDEISSMSLPLQATLLRVLENQEIRPVGSNKIHQVRARVIVATNEPLDKAVSDKKFRMDLYFRIAHFHIPIPPLRERLEDIPLLARHFLKTLYADIPFTIQDDFLEALKKYEWPGNVRELKNEMERIAFLAGDSHALGASLFEKDRAERPSFGISPPVAPSTPSIPLQTRGVKTSYAAFRLQRLRDLFGQHPKLSRLDVIQLLQYAPATVANDLKVLEQEKWIRRIHTSAHPRTSYFVRD